VKERRIAVELIDLKWNYLEMDRRRLNQSAGTRSVLTSSPTRSFHHATPQHQQQATDWESLESTFMKCLREIEKAYLVLPKVHRIRVEKWIEKLVITGNNPTWRKHRNAFARLLLNQVIAKHLSEPFNVLPPDGPLPTFPLHLKPAMRDLLGPHETSFWRGIYERYQDVPSKENLVFDGQSFHYNITDHANQSPTSFTHGREADNLTLLVKEQNQRIQLLEQQLHEERVKNELQIQRLHYTHRMELNKLLEENTKLSKDLLVSSSFERRSFSAASPARSHGISPQPSTSPSTYFGTRAKRVQSPLRGSIHGNSLLRSHVSDIAAVVDPNIDNNKRVNNYRYQNVDEDLALSQTVSSQQFEAMPTAPTQPTIGGQWTNYNQSQTVFDSNLTRMPPPPPSQAAAEVDLSHVNTLYQGSHRKEFEEHQNMVYGDVANEYSSADILPFPKFPLGTDSTLMDNMSIVQKTAADDEFLNYLDDFQNELRQVNLDPTSVVRLSHE
jgi:hypothetical protein